MSEKAILLFGGNSEERLVSVASAQNLAQQFEFSDLYFQDKGEKLYRVPKEELFAHKEIFLREFKPTSAAVANSLVEAVHFFREQVVFLGWHGAQGENGDIQKLFESHKIVFTGSGSVSSHAAFEKNIAKAILRNANLKMPVELKVRTSQLARFIPQIEKFLRQHKKIVIKPVGSGSSYGLHIVDNSAQLAEILDQIKNDQFESYLVENFISGRELTIGIVQDGNELIALPASEIIISEGHTFDYEGKYLGSGAKEITPAELTGSELMSAQKMAVDAHLAMGCYGYSRTDMVLTSEGPFFLEINTLPGLSKPSFLPQQLLAADIPFKQFIEAQIKLAKVRYN